MYAFTIGMFFALDRIIDTFAAYPQAAAPAKLVHNIYNAPIIPPYKGRSSLRKRITHLPKE